jgi:hypothetical protein
MNLSEILAAIVALESLAKEAEKVWAKIADQIEAEKDESKRKALAEAFGRRDCAALRKLLFD